MDAFKGNELTRRVQNREVSGEESRRLVVEGTVRFPAKVNAIPEALGWDDGATGSTNSTFPKIDSALHFVKDGSKISGRVRNLG
jgi:hypothetical protein